jgi:hypothetical protein
LQQDFRFYLSELPEFDSKNRHILELDHTSKKSDPPIPCSQRSRSDDSDPTTRTPNSDQHSQLPVMSIRQTTILYYMSPAPPRLEGRKDLKITGPRVVPAAVARVALAEEAGGLRVPDGRRARGRVAGRPLERPVLPSATAGLGLLAFVSAHLRSLPSLSSPRSVFFLFVAKIHSSARDCSHSRSALSAVTVTVQEGDRAVVRRGRL